MEFPPTEAAYEAIIDKMKALEEEVKRLRNESSATEHRKALTSPPKNVSRVKKHGRPLRNSLAEMYRNNTVLRQSVILLGKEVAMDEWLDWRVKWGQRGTGIFFFIAIICYTVSSYSPAALKLASLCCGVMALIFAGVLFYKNVSYAIMQRILRETNVVVILLLVICNLCIDVLRPHDAFTPINGVFYMIEVTLFLFVDTLKVKSRLFVLAAGSIFVFLNLFNLYGNTFGNWDNGVILFKYTVNGEEYMFLKRSTKRSIFIQVVLFSLKGLRTMWKDRTMELMMFATGNIYRKTGTSSKVFEQESFVWKMMSEKTSRV